NIAETYVHRIGRTARAGASGIAVSFCDPDELDHLRAIERLINADIEVARDESDIAVASHPRPTRSETRSGSSAASRRSPSGGRRGRGRAKTPRSRSTSGKRSRR
ncbi:MAG: hypothetical protein KJO43_04860, partial [Phycisphaerae bacterium]|nr:hypothetical protein [Phycisphaerae bacterium]